MIQAHRAFQNLIVFGSIVPLALFLGYVVATPADTESYFALALIFFVITLPLVLRWHHPALILAWNMSFVIPLRGSPPLWLVLAFLSFGVLIVRRSLGMRFRLQNIPAVTAPLLAMVAVVIITALMRGGLGLGSLGSNIGGGKRSLFVLGAIAGYFALSALPIPPKQARFLVMIYFLGAVTNMVGYLLPFVPQSLYFLFSFFPPETGGLEMVGGEIVRAGSLMSRSNSLPSGFLCLAIAMMAYFGVRPLITFKARWVTRFFTVPGPVVTVLFGVFAMLATIGGFRSILLLFLLNFAVLFVAEGLLKTRVFPILLLMVLLAGSIAYPFVQRLPLGMQRTLSVLPIEVSPIAKYDALGSTEWRLTMWRLLWPEVPKYLWLGKGFAINQAEMEMASILASIGHGTSQDVAMLAGDYHSGPLSVIIPLGIPGVLVTIWFSLAGGRVLWLNYRWSPASLKRINRFLFTAYLSQWVLFLFVFGSFFSQFMLFTGLVGLSVSLNGGLLRREVPKPEPSPQSPQPSGAGMLSPLAPSVQA